MKVSNMIGAATGTLTKALHWTGEAFKGILFGPGGSDVVVRSAKKAEAKRDERTKTRFNFTRIAVIVILVFSGLGASFIPIADQVTATQWLGPLNCKGEGCNLMPSAERCNNIVEQVLAFWKDIQDIRRGAPMGTPQEFLENTLLTCDMLTKYIEEISERGFQIPLEFVQSVFRLHRRMKDVNLDIVPDDLDEVVTRKALEDDFTLKRDPLAPLICWREEAFFPSDNHCQGELIPHKVLSRWGNDLEIGSDMAHLGWLEEFVDDHVGKYCKGAATAVRFLMGQTVSVVFNAYKTFLTQINQEIVSQPTQDGLAKIKGFVKTMFGGGITLLPCLLFGASIAYFPQLFCPGLMLGKSFLMYVRRGILSRCEGNWVTDSMLTFLLMTESISNAIWYLLCVFGTTNILGTLVAFVACISPVTMGIIDEGWLYSWEHISQVNARSFANYWKGSDMWAQDPRVSVCFSMLLVFFLGSFYILGRIYRPVIDTDSIPYNPLVILNKETGERDVKEENRDMCTDPDWQIQHWEKYADLVPGEILYETHLTKTVRNENVREYAKACTSVINCAKWVMFMAQATPIIVTTILNAETSSWIGITRDTVLANGPFIRWVQEIVKSSFPVIGQLNIGDDGFGYIISLLGSYATIPKNQLTGFI